MANEWIDVEAARQREGLRLVLSLGVPGPWGEAAKGVFHAKGIPFTRVIQKPGEPNPELKAWTGEFNAPQAVYEDEPPRDRWSDILFLAERLAPEPALVPADPEARVTLFGLLHEIAGEGGFGWTRRLGLFAPMMQLPEGHAVRELVTPMARRYGCTDEAMAKAPARVNEILRMLSDRLAAQHAAGHEYLMGDGLSAVDIYWAAFAALVTPLPEDVCPMPGHLRTGYAMPDEALAGLDVGPLLAHRDLVYERHMEFPIDLGP